MCSQVEKDRSTLLEFNKERGNLALSKMTIGQTEAHGAYGFASSDGGDSA